MWPLIIAYLLIGVSTIMSWIFVIGAFAVGVGFTGIAIVKLAQRKFWAGIVCVMLALASVFLVYAFYTGALVL